MNTSFPKALAALLPLLFAGCDSNPSASQPPAVQTPPPPSAPPLREETRKLEGAAAVGVDSKQLRRNVDKVLDLKDEHDRQIRETEKSLDSK